MRHYRKRVRKREKRWRERERARKPWERERKCLLGVTHWLWKKEAAAAFQAESLPANCHEVLSANDLIFSLSLGHSYHSVATVLLLQLLLWQPSLKAQLQGRVEGEN